MKSLLAVLIFVLMAAPVYAQGTAEKYYRAAAEQGDVDFQYLLGAGYLRDILDPPGDADPEVEGIKWIRKAAERGHEGAQFHLGMLYEFGDHIQQDHAKAAMWYRKAAKQGNADAQDGLERMRDLKAAN